MQLIRLNIQYSTEYISVKAEESTLTELILSCPCACNLDCGVTHVRTGEQSIGPAPIVDHTSSLHSINVDGGVVEDQAVCFDNRCHDDPAYVTHFGTTCADHHGLWSSSDNCYDSWIETGGQIRLTGEYTNSGASSQPLHLYFM